MILGGGVGRSPGNSWGGGGGLSVRDWGISPGVFWGGYPLVIGGLSPGDSGWWWYPLVGGGWGGPLVIRS